MLEKVVGKMEPLLVCIIIRPRLCSSILALIQKELQLIMSLFVNVTNEIYIKDIVKCEKLYKIIRLKHCKSWISKL